jgi:hypothetical protein
MIRMKNPAGLQSTVLSLHRGKFLDKRLGDPPTSEADHFIRRLEHAGEGWRPFAVPTATALHGVRIVLHAALIGHVAYQRANLLIFNF